MSASIPKGRTAVMRAPGLEHVHRFVSRKDAERLMAWVQSVHPVWEERYVGTHARRQGQSRRRLLRPVYWLGGWQHACRGYYAPPEYIDDRVMSAEPFPPVLRQLADAIEERARAKYAPEDCPPEWRLNTCLVNFYGLTKVGSRWVDRARLGGHRDHEPGPVASISLGAKGLFQFSKRPRGPEEEGVELQGWLRDRSMLLFATERWKREFFHRVPRVAREDEHEFALPLEGFRPRRVNFTLRYVPEDHIVPYADMSAEAREQVRPFVQSLAAHAPFFADALACED